MTDAWLLLLVFSAIAIGWLLGWRSSLKRHSGEMNGGLHSKYYKGLNYLLNDQPDSALDAFISALEVNSETLETHIAVGNLMRRKGEVERAIRIHQNLLSRPSLPRAFLHQAHLELALDFISAGLLDRAERLLKDLLIEAPELSVAACRYLLEIYQDEKEWNKAIDVARGLLPKRSLLKATAPADKGLLASLSHCCCELAAEDLTRNDYLSARSHLKQALGYDRDCVRASLLIADIEHSTGNNTKAIKALRRVRDQDIAFISETIPLLKLSYQQLGDQQGLRNYLSECLQNYPAVSVLLALVDDLKNHQGSEAALEFAAAELARQPSLQGVGKLVELFSLGANDGAKNNLLLLQSLIEQLMQKKAQYQCQHCGFSGKQLHWLCPSCKHWGEVKPINGIENNSVENS